MTIYIDYIRNSEIDEIIFLSLFDEDGSRHDFFNHELSEIESFLTQAITMVAYERPLMHLTEFIDEDRLEDFEVRKYYVDLFRFLEEQTGYKISFSGLARATLGPGPQSFITKLLVKDMTIPSLDVQSKVHERLRALRDIYLSILNTGIVNFYFKRTLHSMEVDLSERP